MKRILKILLFLLVYSLSFATDLILKNNLCYEKNKNTPYTGSGTYSIWINNNKNGEYSGELKNGVFIGKGIYYKWWDGNYQGKVTVDYKNGFLFPGYGIDYDKYDNIVYEGDFKEGYYSGKGTYYYWSNEGIYLGKIVGEFEKANVNGYATVYSYDDTIEYEGEMRNGQYQGKGTYYWSTSDKIDGTWKNGELMLVDEKTKKTYTKSLDKIYSENFVEIYDTKIIRFEDTRTVGVRFKIKNKGSRNIILMRLMIEYKNNKGNTIYENVIYPICSFDYYDYNVVEQLKENYIYQMPEEAYFKDYKVPTEWNGDYKISVEDISLTNYGIEN